MSRSQPQLVQAIKHQGLDPQLAEGFETDKEAVHGKYLTTDQRGLFLDGLYILLDGRAVADVLPQIFDVAHGFIRAGPDDLPHLPDKGSILSSGSDAHSSSPAPGFCAAPRRR